MLTPAPVSKKNLKGPLPLIVASKTPCSVRGTVVWPEELLKWKSRGEPWHTAKVADSNTRNALIRKRKGKHRCMPARTPDDFERNSIRGNLGMAGESGKRWAGIPIGSQAGPLRVFSSDHQVNENPRITRRGCSEEKRAEGRSHHEAGQYLGAAVGCALGMFFAAGFGTFFPVLLAFHVVF